MFKYTTPEKKGISSQDIEKYIRLLESRRLCTHDMIIMRGDEIVFEHYWKPFDKDFSHRMYSVSKSFSMNGLISEAIASEEEQHLI